MDTYQVENIAKYWVCKTAECSDEESAGALSLIWTVYGLWNRTGLYGFLEHMW